MVLSLSQLSEPIGSIKEWLPATTGLAGATVPQGWLVCDGSVVVDAASPYNGIALPDARAKFKRGHATLSNASFPADNLYKAGGTIPTGGADSNNLTHNHAYNVAGGGHSHTVSAHSHTISSDGSHAHSLLAIGNVLSGLGGHQNVTDNQGSHSHSGATGNSSPGTDSYAGFNISGSTNNGLAATDNRPAYQEYVTIIKVK